MQWDAERGAGFTTAADTWLPLAPDYQSLNVAQQASDPGSHLSFYRRLIWYRKGSTALRRGSYRALDGPPDTFIFLREHADERLLIALNFAGEQRRITLPGLGKGHVALATDPDRTEAPTTANTFTLGPEEGLVVALS
jgi:alpha-glucosidase